MESRSALGTLVSITRATLSAAVISTDLWGTGYFYIFMIPVVELQLIHPSDSLSTQDGGIHHSSSVPV